VNNQTLQMLFRLRDLGLSSEEAAKVRRISMTLQRWGELECGNGNDYASWSIERDPETEKPYLVTHPHQGKSYRRPIADRERGALHRMDAIMNTHPDLTYYHQGDPRGCAIFVIKRSDIPAGASLDSCYNRGVAVSQ
jgi:hypothetical protein